MKPRELLLAACLLCAVVATIALVRAVEWTRAHWVMVALLVLVLALAPMYLWHRRQMVYYREQWMTGQDWVKLPGWAQREVWVCPHCKAMTAGLSDAEAHMDPEESACAAFRAHLETQEERGRLGMEASAARSAGVPWSAVTEPHAEQVEE